MDFTAIDFETANSSTASACAVGLARIRDGVVVETAGWLIQPPPGFTEFHERNVEIHGIRPEHVLDAVTWTDQLSTIADFTGDDVLVAHNAGFDMSVLRRASAATGDACPPFAYLCSVQVSRKVYDIPSHSLPFAAAAAGFTDFRHHDARADAEACAHIIIDAARRTATTDVSSLARAVGVSIKRIPRPALVGALA